MTSTTVQARRLIAALAEEEEIEVRRVDPVARGLAQLIERQGRPPSGVELEAWLDEHELVTNVYTDVEALDDLLRENFPEAFAPQSARNEELEQQLRESSDDPAGYQIYADWLLERGDPLGQLMALAIAGDSEGFERWLALHKDHFLGHAGRLVPDHVELEWRFGVVRSLSAKAHWGVETWQELLQLPVCRLLQRVELTLESDDDRSLLPLLADQAPLSLGTLKLVSFGPSSVPVSDVMEMPQLRELELIGRDVELPETTPETLERLSMRVSLKWGGHRDVESLSWSLRQLELGLRPGDLKRLSRLELPRLERLKIFTVGIGGDFDLAGWLEQIAAPELRCLAFVGRVAPDTLRAIDRLPLATRLERLELRQATISDEAMIELAQEGLFPALEELDVSENELTERGLAAARNLAPVVIAEDQAEVGTAWTARLRGFGALQIWEAEKVARKERFWDGPFIDGALIWGAYTGYFRYELYLSRTLERFGCTCESEILPCKHVVALGLLAAKAEPEAKPSDGIEQRVEPGIPTLR